LNTTTSGVSPSPAGYQYLRIENDILVVGIGTRIVAALVAGVWLLWRI